MQTEHDSKHFNCALSLKQLDEEGEFAGYASIFDTVDGQKDIIRPGAFSRTLGEKSHNIKLLWQHKADEPIGVLNRIREDVKGLYVEGRLLLDVQRAREAYALLKSGAINGLSIGYSVREFEFDSDSGIRTISDMDLWEVSLVTFPANSEAGITAVKDNPPKTIREFESFLRDAGFSRTEAKAIAGGGFGEYSYERDATDEDFIRLDRAFDYAINNLS